MYFEVRSPSLTTPEGEVTLGLCHFETLSQDQAIGFAQARYARSQEVCEVREVEHESRYFRSVVEP